ncbi:hypothetical protein E2C01_042954 [Portunus trituberculatus]|uniref:Uncharacterized protein n=1 Tax=Portunus trituberculatus TaxID=210409 RepID=A0A5B7FV08_PORTR|nr:hypothetical protein [Portunus trituberculatus]
MQSLHYPLSCPPPPSTLSSAAVGKQPQAQESKHFPSEIYLGHGILHRENPRPERIPLWLRAWGPEPMKRH